MMINMLRKAVQKARISVSRAWQSAKRVAKKAAQAVRSLWEKHRRKMQSDARYAEKVHQAASAGSEAVTAVVKRSWGAAAAAVVSALVSLILVPVVAS